MNARTRSVASLALTAGLCVGVLAACIPKRIVTGWTPSWANNVAATSFDTADDLFSEVSPFWFNVTSATTITSLLPPAEQAKVLTVAKAAHVPIVPSLADATAPRAMAAILADPAQRTAHVNAIAAFVAAGGYDGVDLDYEKFAYSDGRETWATTRPNWVAFVKQLAAILHERGRLLTVTVPPTYDANQGPNSGYWVYDYAGVAPHVDRLRIMAYDYSVSKPGPIGPLWWADQILAYAVTKVPRPKLQLGVPAYGRNWVASVTGVCPVGADLRTLTVRMSDAAALAAAKKATPVRNQASDEMTFSYTDVYTGPAPPPTTTTTTTTTTLPGAEAAPLPVPDVVTEATTTCSVRRTVWYPDKVSMLDKAKLVSKYSISGIAQWAVGFEDRAQWADLRSYAGTLTHPAGVDPIGRLDAVTATKNRITVWGWALDPETDLPLRVVIRAATVTREALANVERADVAKAYPGAGPFHGFLRAVPAEAGLKQVCVDAVGVGAGKVSVRLGCQVVRVPA